MNDAKKKLLLIAYRAIGDFIYTAPMLPYLFEKFDVHLECTEKVLSLVHDDPRFTSVTVFPYPQVSSMEERERLVQERWKHVRELVKADAELNLNGTLEAACIAEKWQDEFNWPVGERRVRYGVNGFYDAIWARLGTLVPRPFDTTGLYFTEKYEGWVKGWRKHHEGKFLVMIPMAGTTAQKKFYGAVDLARRIVDKYSDAVVFLTGDQTDEAPKDHDRIRVISSGSFPIKQVVLMAREVDMVIGPETSLLVAAGMWGTPKVFLATTSSVYQMTQYQKNDFSIQAPIWCSPCHRAIYEDTDCESMVRDSEGKALYPACTKLFDLNEIMKRVDHVYVNLRKSPANAKA